ncbi:MAG TPA: ABC transporter permease [Candidatus Polarisedimenticolia bacterium]|jgi:peptide/nickel transport system permease protein|nr:ABC transporter permease [Candidatus Polarisedimenticolia bacterium]
MAGFLIRRILSVVPTLLGITLITFLLLEKLPGREMALVGSPGAGLPSVRALEEVRRAYHFDEPVPRRYARWVLRLARWDLGESMLEHRPVGEIIAAAALPTFLLNFSALLLAFGVSIPLGVGWARRRGTASERAGTTLFLLLYAFPNFAAALLLQQFLSVRLGLFPLQGLGGASAGAGPLVRAADFLRHLALPALCLSYGSLAYLTRFTRANLLEEIGREYLTAARARGLGERLLAWKHALRNAAIPLLTLVGLLIPALLGGSVLIETIFSWPGLGRLYFYSLTNRDFPVILALTTLAALLTLGGSFLADLLYALADPRLRREET